MTFSRILPFIALVILLFADPAAAQTRPSDPELVKALKAGGYVIVIRHGATNTDMADTDPLNHDNIAQQRQLSAKGEEAARSLGLTLNNLNVRLHRARQRLRGKLEATCHVCSKHGCLDCSCGDEHPPEARRPVAKE